MNLRGILLGFVPLFCACVAQSPIELPRIDVADAAAPNGDTGVDPAFTRGEEALAYVDPMIGTGGVGFAYAGMTPAVQVPLGFLRVGPDTTRSGSHPSAFHHFSGYYAEDPHLRGFSHTHFVGTGVADYGNLRIAFADAARLDRAPSRWWLTRGPEVAEPGYYRAETAEGVVAELTAAHHAAIHRYELPPGYVLAVDAASSVDDDGVLEAEANYADGRVRGRVLFRGGYVGRGNPFELHFAIRLQPPPSEVLTWDGERWAPGPETAHDEAALGLRWAAEARVSLHVGISLVSADNAARRLEEIEAQSFEAMRADNRALWAEILDRVQVHGGSAADREIFYTALYNSFRMPSRLDEYGEYPGLDGAVHAVDHPYYTDLSLWDTYRTLHPLWTLIAPDETRDVLRSLLLMAKDGGYIPRWPAALSYTSGMEGDSAAMLFAEGAVKGIDGVDYAVAFDHLRATADAPVPAGAPYGGRDGIDDFIELGWIAADRHSAAASNTLEYAVDDGALAVLAEFLGRDADAARYRARSRQYANVWDPATRFFRPRNADGTFVEPFSPTAFSDRSGVYAEGSAWHYRFYAAHDPAGLIELFGGPDELVAELDTFMAESRLFRGDPSLLVLPDPYYWHTNQPPLHAPFLYGWAGRWDLLSHWVGAIRQHAYGTEPDGLVGNDDGGTLSAWYVLASLGLFPIVGTERWLTFAPAFDDVRILGRPPAWYDDPPGERLHAELLGP